ncbi:glycoside hydrolase family 5 protein [Maribacter sp. 2210JD10-5]|uniref:glycoside hydrolase family 5 protein n=1 Tax=Maribacter sp. 2210JD10-5 TaxID=3386272 RepID=UPI0039BD6059
MKKIFLLIFVIVLTSFNEKEKQNTFSKFEVHRGTNIAHWLSQTKTKGAEREAFFTKSDVAEIAKMGFDHLRVPIDEENMWDDNGKPYEDAFQLLENCINWAAEYKLRVIVDMHILRSHYFNAEVKPLWTEPAEQEKFFDLWRQLSKRLGKFPNGQVAYELMNEAVADDNETWNKLLVKAFEAIRELEPERTIVIGSNRWQSVNTFDELKVPANDKNILLSFHFYEPFLLSHYSAGWTKLKDYEGPVHYPGVILTDEEFMRLSDEDKMVTEEWKGKTFNKEVMLAMWKKPLVKAKELGLPLYCGEFGIMATAPEKDRLLWYKDMVALFEETGIGYANWNYKSDNFGLIDGNKRNEDLIKIMTSKK